MESGVLTLGDVVQVDDGLAVGDFHGSAVAAAVFLVLHAFSSIVGSIQKCVW